MAPRKKTSKASPSIDGPGRKIGAALRHWRVFLEHVRAAAPEARAVWKTYAGKTGRQCVIRGKGRNLAYLKPGEGSFLVSVALSDEAVAGLRAQKLPEALIAEITASSMSPEGTPARVRVDSAPSLTHAAALFTIKVADAVSARSRR
ncbi:MAG: DUF3788 family protein [Phycisphaeraceae bacterium]|nr:DUF3788 family protein [Phycisphaeraceae bacterium]